MRQPKYFDFKSTGLTYPPTRTSLLRPLAGIGVLLLFISMFLPWLGSYSLLFGYNREIALNVSTFALVVLLLVAGFVGGLYVVGGHRGWSPAYPGLLAVLAAGFWLYQLSESGLLSSSSSTALFGPYIAIIGGALLIASSFSRGFPAGYGGQRDYPHERRRDFRGSGRGFYRPRIRLGSWVLAGLWFVATIGVAQFLLPPDSAVWYLVDIVGVVAGLWLGVGYFRWIERTTYSTGKLFIVTVGSFILFPIIGGLTLGFYPASPCTIFPNILPSCQGTSYSPTFNNFYAPTYLAGFINSFISFTTPLALCILLATLYGGYRLSHTIFVR